MADRQRNGLCHNCDEKYVKGHRCCEQEIFHMDVSSTPKMEDLGLEEPSKEEPNEQTFLVQDTVEPSSFTMEAVISLHALSGVFTPQNLKIKGYIKYHQLVVLINSGNTHNFINRSRVVALHIFIHPINNFQVLIANECTMKCGGRCENVKFQMGDYHLKTCMFAIDMGGCDIVLGVEWLRTLMPITMDFQDLYIWFVKDSHSYLLQGIKANPPEIINSHCMENILKQGH